MIPAACFCRFTESVLASQENLLGHKTSPIIRLAEHLAGQAAEVQTRNHRNDRKDEQ